MITFKDKLTQAIFEGTDHPKARRIPENLRAKARAVMEVLDTAVTLNEVASIPKLRLERLQGDRKGLWSVRVDGPNRIVFAWIVDDSVPSSIILGATKVRLAEVEFVDYH